MSYTIYDSMSGEPLEECSGLCLAEAAEYLLGCDSAQFEFRAALREDEVRALLHNQLAAHFFSQRVFEGVTLGVECDHSGDRFGFETDGCESIEAVVEAIDFDPIISLSRGRTHVESPVGSVSLWRSSVVGDRSWKLLAPFECFDSESEAQQWVVDLDDSWGGYEARLDGAS